MSTNGKEEMFALDSDSDIEARRPAAKHTLLYVVAGVMVASLLILVLGLYFGLETEGSDIPQRVPAAQQSRCIAGSEFNKFTVSTDTSVCSEIGCQVLQKGGSAVDAAIASMFCITVVTMHSSGIGGGFFMLVYEKQKRKAVFINARETAPGAATKTMYVNNTNSRLGPLSAAVPGEVKGLAEAYKRYGKLPWSELVQPSINLASRGFVVTTALEKAIEQAIDNIKDKEFLSLLTNSEGKPKKAGDTIVNKKLAATLEEIKRDRDCFYIGKLASKIAADFRNNGGLITEEDLKRYKATVTEDVLRIDLNDVEMLSCPPPSGGPVVTQILNILQNFKLNRDSVSDVQSTVLTYHRIIEAFKFAYARRPYLGDPDFVEDPMLAQVVKESIDIEYNRKLSKKIWSNMTHDASYYGGYSYVEDEGSTTHLSVLGPNGDAVAVTGSINFYFGGKFRSNVTGIVYNNEMDDFSTPGVKNGFGFLPSENNFIEPGKRPLSSMSPTIFVDKKTGHVRLAVGAAGGSRIISSTAWIALHNLWLGDSLPVALRRPRLHHQLFPENVSLEPYEEYQISEEIKDGLRRKRHVLKPGGKSVVQAIGFQRDMSVVGVSDPRKGGEAWGL